MANTGTPNPKGLDFYNRLLDNFVANDIAPFPTLYHWDLPQALQDRGGWETRDTADAFADYAGYVAEKLSDRARHFFTLNECATFVELGHATGVFAPGSRRRRMAEAGCSAATLTASEAPWLLSACLRGGEARP